VACHAPAKPASPTDDKNRCPTLTTRIGCGLCRSVLHPFEFFAARDCGRGWSMARGGLRPIHCSNPTCPSRASLLHKLDRDPSAHHGRSPLEARQRDVISCIQQPVNLRAARLQQRGHAVLRYFLFLHRLGELPRDHLFDRLCLRLFEDPLLFQEVINAGTMCFLLIALTPSGACAPMPNPRPANVL
jgi:hypothetical protein